MREASLSRKRALADPTGSPGARTVSGALAGLILEQEGRVFVPDSVSHWLQAAWGEEGGDRGSCETGSCKLLADAQRPPETGCR